MSELTTYEGGEFLTSDEAIAEYLNLALQEDDHRLFILAVGDAARAKGMGKVAELTGIERSTLYRCLSGKHDTGTSVIMRVIAALGVNLAITYAEQLTPAQ